MESGFRSNVRDQAGVVSKDHRFAPGLDLNDSSAVASPFAPFAKVGGQGNCVVFTVLFGFSLGLFGVVEGGLGGDLLNDFRFHYGSGDIDAGGCSSLCCIIPRGLSTTLSGSFVALTCGLLVEKVRRRDEQPTTKATQDDKTGLHLGRECLEEGSMPAVLSDFGHADAGFESWKFSSVCCLALSSSTGWYRSASSFNNELAPCLAGGCKWQLVEA